MGYSTSPGATNDGQAGGAFFNGGRTSQILQQEVNADVAQVELNRIAAEAAAASAAQSAIDAAQAASVDPATIVRLDTAQTITGQKTFSQSIIGNLQGNATTATTAGSATTATVATTANTLTTARLINGTSFNGSADITTANWGTSRTLSYSGDATGSAAVNGSANVDFALTLASSGVTAGTYNNVATQVRPFTVDGKGRITSVDAPVAITVPFADVSSKPTTLAGYGITNAVAKTSNTGSAILPVGTTAQRDGSPAAGYIRYNNTTTSFEGYNGTAWGSIGGSGGATGGAGNAVFHENDQTVTADYTITTNKNAMTAGPITINTGITVTVPTGSTWTIV